MKTIVACSDFSRTAGNAVRYAAAMAGANQLKLVLVHVMQPPVASAEGYVFIPDMTAMKRESLKKLERTARGLRKKSATSLQVECESRIGLPVDEIDLCARERKADLVVMGMRESAPLRGRLLGSVTTAFIRRSAIPVLSIHKKQKYTRIKKIAMATDFRELPDPAALRPLREIAKLYNASVQVLHVFKKEGEVPDFTQAYEGLRLKQRLAGLKHTFNSITDKNIVEGINQFVSLEKSDLLVLISHRHNLLERIFLPSANKKMAFEAIVPLLTLKAL